MAERMTRNEIKHVELTGDLDARERERAEYQATRQKGTSFKEKRILLAASDSVPD